MNKSELERQQQINEKALERATRLESLMQLTEYSIITDVLNEVISEQAYDLLNGKPTEYDDYLVKRSMIDGVRAVQNRLQTIIRNGNMARKAIENAKE